MALNWEWNDKIGTCVMYDNFKNEEYITTLYKGNAFMIQVYEYKSDDGKDMYSLVNFFCDKEHAKHCLGIDKKYKTTYGENGLDHDINRYVEFILDSDRACKALHRSQLVERHQDYDAEGCMSMKVWVVSEKQADGMLAIKVFQTRSDAAKHFLNILPDADCIVHYDNRNGEHCVDNCGAEYDMIESEVM